VIWRRALGWSLAALLGVAGLAVASWFVGIRHRAPPASGSLASADVGAPARISRDPLGVPHIQAEHVRDAFFALGVAHAQDRLWQMELTRRAARGTLSEVFGEKTLPADRLARTLGLARAAVSEGRGLGNRQAELLRAYSAGVNRWLEEITAGRARAPFELVRLGIEAEPWRPEDTLALVRLRAWLLGRSLGSSLLLDRLYRELGGVASQEFFPESSVQPSDNVARSAGDRADDGRAALDRAADTWAAAVGMRGPVGSGGFVIGPRLSRSGLPILANDPHVELVTPAVFYLAHLQTPEWDVAGGTWAGIPVFWTGTNGSIAWGQVALFASTSELYEETLRPSDRRRYDSGGRWREAQLHREQIRVRGGEDREVEVFSTRHGPLLGSIEPGNRALESRALRWTGLGPRSGIGPALEVQRARNWEQFREALRELEAPAATFLYADVEGNVGTQVAGRLPVRFIQTALLPVPGRSGYYAWQGFIPFDELPHQFGSELPFVIASPHPAADRFPHPVAWLWYDGGPEMRLRLRLERAEPLGLADVVELQRERVSGNGPARVRAWPGDVEARSEGAARIQRLLLSWDGSSDVESPGAAVYHAFRTQLARRLLARRLEPPLAAELLDAAEPLPGAMVERFLAQVDREDARSLAGEVLEETWSWLGLEVSSNPSRWSWGAMHRVRLDHAFERLGSGKLPWIGRSVGVGPLAAPGDSESVWAMYSTPVAPFEARVGPGFRFAVDLEDPRHVWVGLAGGQSGHPGSPHYADALDDWLRARPRPLWMHPSDVAYHEQGVWDLHPAER
jgi:penicillin amidase